MVYVHIYSNYYLMIDRTWTEFLGESLGFETKLQRQQREYKEALERKDRDYKETILRREQERRDAQRIGEEKGYMRVTFHGGVYNGLGWSCCGSRVLAMYDGGCEERWVDPLVHTAERCTSGCRIHSFRWRSIWINPEQWDVRCKGGIVTLLGKTICDDTICRECRPCPCSRPSCQVRGRKCLWLLNDEMVANGLKSAQTLLNDKGILPIKKLILLKNLSTKLIPQRSLESRPL